MSSALPAVAPINTTTSTPMVQGPPMVMGGLQQGATTPLSSTMAKKLRTTSLEEALLNAAAAGKHKLDAVSGIIKLK